MQAVIAGFQERHSALVIFVIAIVDGVEKAAVNPGFIHYLAYPAHPSAASDAWSTPAQESRGCVPKHQCVRSGYSPFWQKQRGRLMFPAVVLHHRFPQCREQADAP